ncbi:hypothetical protein SUGI_1003890 [Cryptomeria japonica]|uniref:BTB/POZ domain-containing protein At4g08455 n=1 Tax=Cryptomeria japonica TaxID=3369 RepID=UPI002414C860|nr:BTB/POZ domain-containing protein At4g08455 [Cryptomeria japonica]GLJ47536.1 hypothetical protein SUGI_1003890 [Cryptomeria japonica]
MARGYNEETVIMTCLSCKDHYKASDAGTCRECYEEASETEEELKKEIEELKAKISFLKMWAPEIMLDERTDIALEVKDGSKIKVHKIVLISKSPVFKAMLENEMEESRSGIIKITDFKYEVLRSFVHYLYTAEVSIFPDEHMACDLLVLAEKYQVKHLKTICEKFITSKVNDDNAIMNFAFAHQHNAKHLREAALSLIIENMHTLTTREEYHELVDKDPRLVVEIYELYLSKQENIAVKDSTNT